MFSHDDPVQQKFAVDQALIKIRVYEELKRLTYEQFKEVMSYDGDSESERTQATGSGGPVHPVHAGTGVQSNDSRPREGTGIDAGDAGYRPADWDLLLEGGAGAEVQGGGQGTDQPVQRSDSDGTA